MVFHRQIQLLQRQIRQRSLVSRLCDISYLFYFRCLAVGQANIEWYLNPVPREQKDQVE
jgi:hypothetical protein